MFIRRFSLILAYFLCHALVQIASAQDCGGLTCVDEATCINDECVCPDPSSEGTMTCYRSNEFGAHVINDPTLMTFNKVNIGFPYPCRYLLTDLTTELKNRSGVVVGNCDIKVHVFHGKDKGKIFVQGYDLALRVSYDDGPTLMASFRTVAHAYNGVYTFETNATWGEFLCDGPWDNDDINFDDKPISGLQILLENDDENDYQSFLVKKCGWRSYIRGYDTLLRRNQTKIPGFAMAVNCAFHPEFHSVDSVMALPPTDAHEGFSIDDIRPPGLTNKQTMLDRAFRSNVTQNQPNAGVECALVGEVLEQCDNDTREEGFDACGWMFDSPRYIKCVNPPGSENCDEIVGMFKDCMSVFCEDANCTDFQNGIGGDFGCTSLEGTGYDELDDWIDGDFC